jgi:hypothetical protein
LILSSLFFRARCLDGAASGPIPQRAARAGRIARPDGIAVPFVADPDGVLIMPGLPHQKYNLQLATDE